MKSAPDINAFEQARTQSSVTATKASGIIDETASVLQRVSTVRDRIEAFHNHLIGAQPQLDEAQEEQSAGKLGALDGALRVAEMELSRSHEMLDRLEASL